MVRTKAMTPAELQRLLSADDESFRSMTERLPRQARSAETLNRLLDATEALLTEGGLDAATVPAIAERAGVSVGVVYRRFPDKDALLRAVYLRYFGNLGERNDANLKLLAGSAGSLQTLARKLISAMVKGYRLKRPILRALTLYARTHHDPEFRRAALDMDSRGMKAIAAMLLSRSDEIRHPKPEEAIEFGLVAVAAVLHAVVLEEAAAELITIPADLENELVRMFLGYLGV